MTNNIYPPDHLLRKWEELIIDEEENVDVVLYEAFQAGADQELEACCKWFKSRGYHPEVYRDLLNARRKPPSLKEQALEQLKSLEVAFLVSHGGNAKTESIRRALDALPD